MPDTPVASTGAGITPWIGAAGGLISDITSLFGQSAANRQSQKYNTQMINQQRQWALQDQASQNLYNSPQSQMQRLKAAGLNPNMVYGTGVQGSTGQQTGQPRATAAPSFNPQSVTQGFTNLGKEFLDGLQQYASIKNTEEQTKLTGATIPKIMADKLNVEADTALKDFVIEYNKLYGAGNKEAESNILHSQANIAQSQEVIQDVNAYISQHTKDATVGQALQGWIQSKIKTETDPIIQENLRKTGKILEQSQVLNKLNIQSQTWDFNANSPVWQQLIQKLAAALLSHAQKD